MGVIGNISTLVRIHGLRPGDKVRLAKPLGGFSRTVGEEFTLVSGISPRPNKTIYHVRTAEGRNLSTMISLFKIIEEEDQWE